MKVIFKKHYIFRDIFVIEIDNKIIQCYRSSGLSGTGHGGEIIPFNGLMTETKGLDAYIYSPGYIYKEMYYNKMWIHHKKQIYKYPSVEKKMNEIKELVKDIHPRKHKEVTTVKELLRVAKRIQKDLRKISEGREHYDLYNSEFL